MSGAASVLNLTVAPSNELDVGLNSILSVFGSAIANDGIITVTAGSATNSSLQLNNNVTLSGAGVLSLSYGDHNGNAFIEETGGSFTLTNSGSTIQGNGVIGNGGLTLVNTAGGLINANVSAQSLTLDGSGGITNAGTLEATNGGILQISSDIANTGGTISATTGTVDVSAKVTGGTLSSGSGLLQTAGSATLASVTISPASTYTGSFGTTTTIMGTITNEGAFQLLAGSATNTFLTLGANTSLVGGGAITLNSGDTNGFVYVGEASAGITLSNVDNTIQGYGDIGDGGLTLVNNPSGILDANVSARTLTLDGTGGITNSGVIEATNGGTIHISTTVNNLGGNITASAGTVNLSSTIQGGSLNTSLGGTFQTSTSSTLDGTTQGPVTISNGSVFTGGYSTTTNVLGTVTNLGTILLVAGSANNAILNLDADTTLQGGGTITLNSGDDNGQAFIQSATSANLINVDNTIDGYGIIGASAITLTNEIGGTVNANAAGQTLHLNGGSILNAGLLEATSNGTLLITNSTVANASANITANAGSVLINDTTIEGGTLNQENSGVLATNGTATLDGTTLGPVSLSPGSTYTSGRGTTTDILGTFTNRGALSLLAGSASNAFLNIDSNVTLQGGGAIMLNSGDDNGQAYIQSANSYTLTNLDNSIEGYGDLGDSGIVLINGPSGIVDANSPGQTLLLDGGSIVNQGLLEGTAGGTLRITTLVNNAGAHITADGGNVILNSGAIIRGGTLASVNAGTLSVGAGSTVTLDGAANTLTLSTGSTLSGVYDSVTQIDGTIVNQGTIGLTAGSANNTTLDILSGTTLSGGGTVTLNSGDNNGRAFVSSASGSTLTNVDNTILGYGNVGHGSLALVNGLSGTINANSSGNSLVLDGTGNISNAGVLEATSGGTLLVENVVSNSGSVTAGGGTVDVLGGTIQGGTLNGVALETTSSATLDGATNGPLTLSSGGQFTALLNTTITAMGTITNQGNIQLNAGSATNTFLSLSANTILQGGGTVSLNSGDDNGQAFIQPSVGAVTLTNANDTIGGYGVIGDGGLSFFNDISGVVIANVPGQTLQINATGTVTNGGTFEADGGTLSLVTLPSNLSANTLTGGTWMASGSGTLSFEGTANAIVTNDATIMLNGAGSVIETKTGGGGTYQQVDQTLTTNNATLEVLGGRNFAASNAITNNGLVELGGGTLTAPSLVNDSGAILAGFGTFSPTGGVTIANGAQVSPGASASGQLIATLSFGTPVTLGSGGILVFDIMNAPSAVAGVDNDTLGVSGQLLVTATPTSPFFISLRSVDPGTGGAGLANFNSALPYSWTLASAGSISGFSGTDFSVNASAFQNSLNGGYFSVAEAGNQLTLNFTPVPEPASWMLVLGGCGALAAFVPRGRKCRLATPS